MTDVPGPFTVSVVCMTTDALSSTSGDVPTIVGTMSTGDDAAAVTPSSGSQITG